LKDLSTCRIFYGKLCSFPPDLIWHGLHFTEMEKINFVFSSYSIAFSFSIFFESFLCKCIFNSSTTVWRHCLCYLRPHLHATFVLTTIRHTTGYEKAVPFQANITLITRETSWMPILIECFYIFFTSSYGPHTLATFDRE